MLVFSRALFVGLLLIVWAGAASATTEFENICANQSVPVDPGTLPVNPGLLWNEERSGSGWTLAYSPAGNGLAVHLIWYTYRTDGTPVWYLSDGVFSGEDPVPYEFQTNLYSYSWVPSNNPGERAVKSPTPVGSVRGYFSPTDQSRLALKWSLNNGATYHPECLIDFSREFHPASVRSTTAPGPEINGVNLAFNGAYFDPQNAGWGMLQHVVRTNHLDDQSLYQESLALTIYDDDGQPVWLLGVDPEQPDTTAPPLNTWHAIPLSIYRVPGGSFDPAAYCEATNTSCKPQPYAAGTWYRNFINTTQVQASLAVEVDLPWLSVTDFDIGQPPPAVNAPPAESVTLTRLTLNNYIAVDRAPCVAYPGQATCNVSINWSAVDDGSGVCLMRVETGAGASPNPPVCNPVATHGELDISLDPLVFGQDGPRRLYYELRSGHAFSSRTPNLYAIATTSDPLTGLQDATYPSTEATVPHTPGLTRLPGAAGVSGGAATYSVPIEVPPGRRGMQPSISLEYSSRAGNGIAGMGFSLSSGSSLHRCPHTLEQDGATRPVRLDGGDKLCLDGQRLVVEGSGSYGTANTVYRTEIDSFVRVRQLGGGLGDSGTWFEVRNKDGELRVYGATPAFNGAGAVVRPMGTDGELSVLSWMLAERRDTVGNLERHIYTSTTNVNGVQVPEVLLKEIRYTGHRSGANLTEGNRSVKFTYAARPDSSSSYVGGGVLWQTQLLTRIETYAPSSADTTQPAIEIVKAYDLTYYVEKTSGRAPDPITLPPVFVTDPSQSSGRSLLRSITEVARQGTVEYRRAPTTFEWQDGVLTSRERLQSELVPPVSAPVGGAEPISDPQGLIRGAAPVKVLGDFDGDGHRDLLARGANGESYLLTLGASRQVLSKIDMTGVLGETEFSDARIALEWYADVDLDARQDLLGYERADATKPADPRMRLVIYRSTQEGPSADRTFDKQFPAARRIYTNVVAPRSELVGNQRLIDMNSDGYPDLLWLRSRDATTGCAQRRYTVLLNLRNGQFQAPADGVSVCLPPVVGDSQGYDQLLLAVEDVNSDGVVDLVLGSEASFADRSTWSFVRFGSVQPAVGGQPAAYAFGGSEPIGTLFGDTDSTSGQVDIWGHGGSPQLFQRGDFNGDGLTDLAWIARRAAGLSPTQAEWVFRLATGRGFGPKLWSGQQTGLRYKGTPQNGLYINAGLIQVADTNADGRDELVVPTGFAQVLCVEFFGNLDSRPPADTPSPTVCATPEDVLGRNRLVHPDQRFVGCIADNPENGEAFAGTPERFYACPEHPVTGNSSFKTSLGNPVNFIDSGNIDTLQAVDMFVTGRGGFNSATYTYSAIDISFAATSSTAADLSVEFADARPLPQAFVPGEDLFSDGLADGLGTSGCAYGSQAACSRISKNDLAPEAALTFVPSHNHDPQMRVHHLSESLGVGVNGAFSLGAPTLPDLLSAVVEPVAGEHGPANVFEWRYSPLSGLAGRPATGLPLYSLKPPSGDTGAYADERHFYFTSSMPVVAEFSRPAGVSNAQGQALQNTTLYGYGQAMYHAFGRGFQGFRSIQEWDLTQGSALETVFHQRFPLTSRVERQTVRVLHVDGAEAAPGLPLSITRNDWRCGLSNRAACPSSGANWSGGFPFLDRTEVETFDAASAESGASQTAIARKTVSYTPWPELSATTCPALPTTGSSGYDSYGNLRHKVELVEDLGTGARLSKACSLEQHDYQPADISAAVWWVNRLQQTTQHRRVEYSSLHALPSGVTAADLNPGQSRRSKFVWDNATRLLSTQEEALVNAAGAVQEVMTTSTFSYPQPTASTCAGATSAAGANGPNYGLPTCVSVTRGNVTAGQGAASSIPLATASPAKRDTRTAYSTDGYFPREVRNALGHTVSTVVRPRDGQPSEVTDANGLQTTMQYDAFGFLQRTRYPQRDSASLGRQPDAVTGIEACGTAGVDCSGIAGALYRQQTVARGAPTRMQYFDVLGREIASEVEVRAAQGSIGGARISRSGVFHNARGLVTREAAPVAVTAFGASVAGWPTAYTEYSDFDVLGRAGHKREVGFGRLSVAANDNAFGNSVAAPDRATDYTYSGQRTEIRAYLRQGQTTTGVRTLSREVDGLGRHLRTVDASDPNNTNGSGGSTAYWFDAWGQPTVIRDAKGVLTRAVHDAAGRRHLTIDPNQGTSTYLYSGFGELLRQVDARGVALEYAYDALGRQTLRKSDGPALCNFADPNALTAYAEFGNDCGSKVEDRFFFDGVIDTQGASGSAYALGLPSGHARQITANGSTRIERQVSDYFDSYGRPIERRTVQDLSTPSPVIYTGQRRYSHRWKYDSRFGRLLGESWPNGVGRGFTYSSIGAVEAETGLGDDMPLVLREVTAVNALGQATDEWLGGTAGAGLRVQRTQTIATGELQQIDYARRATGAATPAAIWAENYRYDGFGNLLRRAQLHDGGGTGQFRQYEHYQYDLLHRMTASSLSTNGAAAVAVAFGYDEVGNLRKKTDYSSNGDGAYVYPLAAEARPNAVRAVYLAGGGSQNYRYDATGNVVCGYLSQGFNTCNSGYGLRAHYNHNHQPTHQQRLTWNGNTITSNNSVSFTYGADQQPARQLGLEQLPSCVNLQGGCLPHHRIYLDRYEDTVGAFRHFDTGVRQYRTRAYVGDYLVATRGRYGELELSFLLRDRLGSVVGVESARLTNRQISSIVPETRHGFDAYGAPRNNRRWNVSAWETADNWSSPTRTQQGFTGHERLSGLQLIHMKGRVFDPILGRFHGVDPIIQFPLSSQGLNPYSYILNNPMAGVDPTGYASCSVEDSKSCLEEGSNKIYDDKGNYLGKLEVGKESVSFAPTEAGWGYKSNNGASAQVRGSDGKQEGASSELGAIGSRSSQDQISNSVGTSPIALGVDPHSDRGIDQQSGNLVPGVGLAQCLSGSVECSGAETIVQGGAAVVGVWGGPWVSRMAARMAGKTGAPSVWTLMPFLRGEAIERALGQNLPRTFPVIDRFSGGLATSIKSIDLAAKTYQIPGKLRGTLASHVNSLARFDGATLGNVAVGARFGGQPIVARQLQVAIPSNYTMSAAQQAAIQAVAQDARSRGIHFVVTQVP